VTTTHFSSPLIKIIKEAKKREKKDSWREREQIRVRERERERES